MHDPRSTSRRLLPISCAAALGAILLAAPVSAQGTGNAPGRGQGAGQGQGQGQGQDRGARRGGGSPEQFVERLMAMDANGDGMLSRDEVPGRLAERMFESADTNGDGVLDKAEIEAMAANRGGARGGQAGQGRGQGQGRGNAAGGPGGASFSGSMSQMGRAFRALNRSSFDESTRARDLEAVLGMQLAVVGAKRAMTSVRMGDDARARFGDETAFRLAFRKYLGDTLIESVRLELAIAAGDAEAAKASLAKLKQLEERGHEIFPPDEDAGADGADGANGQAGQGRGGRGGAGGAGGRGGRGGGNNGTGTGRGGG